MSSFAGVIAFGPAADLPERVERMRPYLGCGIKGQQSESALRNGGGVLCTTSAQGSSVPSMAVCDDSEVIAAYIGLPMFSAGDTESESRIASEPERPNAGIALCHKYRREETAFVDGLQGSFSLAVWDARKQRLVLVSDRLGSRPLYYAIVGPRVVFATDARALLADENLPRQISEQTLCEYLALGFPLENRTLLEQVHLVNPGSVVVIEQGRVTSSTYYPVRFDPTSTTDESLEQEFCDRFLAVMRDLTHGEGTYAVPLSGGLDSRCIAAALWRCERQAEAFTIGAEGTEDVRLAQLIAKRLGFRHHVWQITPADFLNWVEEGVRLTDGMLSAFDTHILFVAKHLPKNAVAVFDGISCSDSLYSLFEVLLSRISPSYVQRRLSKRLYIQLMVDPSTMSLDPAELFSGGLRADAERRIRRSFEDVVEESGDGALFDRFDIADLRQRIRRYNFAGSILLNAYATVHCPFFHPDVFDVALRLPPRLRVKEKPIERKLVQYLAPQLNDIPYERTDLSPTAGSLRIFCKYGERKLKSIGRKLVDKSSRRNGYHAKRGVAIDYQRWMRESREMQDFVREILLSQACLDRGYYDEAAVRTLVESHFNGHGVQPALIGRMLSVELWHRMFVDRVPAAAAG